LNLVEAMQSGREVIVSGGGFERFGIDKKMLDTGVEFLTNQIAEIESAYNSTPWWPVVADVVDWGRSLGSAEDVAETSWMRNRTEMLGRAEMLFQLAQKDEMADAVAKAKDALAYVPRLASFIVAVVTSLTSSVATSIFFVSFSSSLLAAKENVLHVMVRQLFGDVVEQKVRGVLAGVIVYPVALAFGRLFYTLPVCLVLGIPYPFLLTALTSLVTVVPLLSAYPVAAALPWVIGFAFSGRLLQAVLLAAAQTVVLKMVEMFILDTSVGTVPSWVSALSVVLGFERFGIQALVIGPLVLSVLVLFYESMISSLGIKGDDASDEPAPSAGTMNNERAMGRQRLPGEHAAIHVKRMTRRITGLLS